MEVRELTRPSEFEPCLELQREGFGWADIDLMPVRLFVVAHLIGGLVLGAYEAEKLIGFSSALPGIRNGMTYWHSHMLAVTEAYRNFGVGAQLKLSQKDFALRRGIHLIEWTFDPLESKNAYLNIEKLGILIRRYYPDLYGQTSGNAQRGLASDRIVAEWWLDHPRALAASPYDDSRRVTIPADIQALKKRDLEAARDLQIRVREQFLRNAADDFVVIAFERNGDTSDYIFVRGASRVDQAG